MCANNKFPKLNSLPGFEEIVKSFPIDRYSYVVQFIETGYESEEIICYIPANKFIEMKSISLNYSRHNHE